MAINQFIAAVKDKGLAKSSKYMVVFDIPRGPQANDGVVNPWQQDYWQRNNNSTYTSLRGGSQLVSLYCDAVSMPALNIDSKLNKIYGPGREMPYGRSYTPVNFSFYIDRDYIIKKFFDTWQNSIFDRRTGHMNYYNEYTTQVHILALDATEGSSRFNNSENEAYGILKATYQCSLMEAYPKTVAEVAYTAGGTDIARLQVSIQYRSWQETTQPYGIGRVSGEETVPSMINYDPSTGLTVTQNGISGPFDTNTINSLRAWESGAI